MGWPPRPRVGPGFFKAHGLGNDYLVFEEVGEGCGGARMTPQLVRRICDRHRGPGGDGIVVVERGVGGAARAGVGAEHVGSDGREAPRLRMFNPDGGEFERSGNGLRVAGVFLRKRGWGGGPTGRGSGTGGGNADGAGRREGRRGSWFPVIVAGDRVHLRVEETDARGVHDAAVEMGRVGYPDGPPFVEPGRVGEDGTLVLPLEAGDASGMASDSPGVGGDASDGIRAAQVHIPVVPVSVGNPHAVAFAGEPDGPGAEGWTQADVERCGPLIERHPAFPQGANVQFAERPAGGAIAIRIWERGVGPTLSSGTSACATVAAAVRVGLLPPGTATVVMEGGEMEVELRPDDTVRLRGPVEEVFTGTLAANLAG